MCCSTHDTKSQKQKMEIKVHISRIPNVYLPNQVLHDSHHYSYCSQETTCCTLDDSEFHIVGKET